MRQRHRDRLARAAALSFDQRAEMPWSAWCAAAIEQNGALTNAGPGRDVSNEKDVDAPIDAMTIDSQPFTSASGESSPNAEMRACTRRGFDRGGRRRRVRDASRRPVPQPSTNTSLRSIERAGERAPVAVRQVDLEAALAPGPARPRAGCVRSFDPPGGSSSHTSAPASASTWPTMAVGRALAVVTTRRPARGRGGPSGTWCIPSLCQ